ncbi:MAG: hypothetical protein DRI46_07450 [Chloroflexi bacterium]|nr:MAG: hypothetical protein DRI46_07450 [Chloroflexota bacterium]
MKSRIAYTLSLSLVILIITACAGSASTGPTNTPDPSFMSINERAIWDFDNYRNELKGLVNSAADAPTESSVDYENLAQIVYQIGALSEQIDEYEVPLSFIKAQSALSNFAHSAYMCYNLKYQEYVRESVGDNTASKVDYSICDKITEYEESYDLFLQELKANNSE